MLIERRVDRRIRASEVRVIGPGEEALGILPLAEALARARELGLNLIEVSPTARPPVCKIGDHGKLKYEEKCSLRLRPKPKPIKELRLRPRIGAHDLALKREQLRAFLEDGCSVRVTLVFRGREQAFYFTGSQLFLRLLADVSAAGAPTQPPKREGRQLSALVIPRGKKVT